MILEWNIQSLGEHISYNMEYNIIWRFNELKLNVPFNGKIVE